MVKKPSAKPTGQPAGKPDDTAAPRPRERIVEALMKLAAERPWDEIGINDIAREAGVTLAEFRDLFASKGAILGGFSRMIDRKVLDGTTGDMADEPARERLFDVFMRRIDALTPYKASLQLIARALRRDPLSMAALNQMALNSQRFMLAAAGIDTEGPLGLIKLQGAVVTFARTLDVWFDDDDPGLARTLAHLDRALRRGEMCMERAEDVHRLTAPLRAMARAMCDGRDRMRRRSRERARDERRSPDDDEDYVPAA